MEHDSFDDSCAMDPRDVDADAEEERDMRRSSDDVLRGGEDTHAHSHTLRERQRDTQREKETRDDERVARYDKTNTCIFALGKKRHLKMFPQHKLRARETKDAQSRSSALFFVSHSKSSISSKKGLVFRRV